jgi:O-antigen/teichoic acid export membrane protein
MRKSFLKVKGTAFNFLCRSGGIFAKFLLVIYITKSMSLETLGLYNLISVTVAWSIYVLGFEFYSFSLRQIVGEKTEVIAYRVLNQFLFHAFAFLLLLLASPLLVVSNIIPVEVLGYFILITLFDQLSQEIYRICIAMERSQFANLLYFVKSGFWVYILLLAPLLGKTIDIHLIFGSWLGGTIIAFAMGAIKLHSLRIISFQKFKVDYKWIKTGIVVSLPFVIISTAQLTMDFSDRYLIDHFLGKRAVGIYSFYYGIANVPITLVTNVLVAQYYSRVINVYKFEEKMQDRSTIIKKFFWQSVAFALVICGGVTVLLKPLLIFVGKQELLSNINVFYVMLAHVLLFTVQSVVQTILYAKHKDKELLYSAIAGATFNIVLNLILLPHVGIMGAALATLISMFVMLVVRLYYLRAANG